MSEAGWKTTSGPDRPDHPDHADQAGPGAPSPAGGAGVAGVAGGFSVSPEPARPTVIVSGVASDSHTWNLVFLQLLVEELGYEVVNLGACVPDELLESECAARRPAMVVLSSINGHGYQDGLRVVRRLRSHADLAGTPIVIGGKLGILGRESDERVGRLLAAGFTAVFDDRADAGVAFRRFTAELPERAAELPGRATELPAPAPERPETERAVRGLL